jgi:hypothetical protein
MLFSLAASILIPPSAHSGQLMDMLRPARRPCVTARARHRTNSSMKALAMA